MTLLAELASPGYGTLAALVLFIGASVWLGALAQRIVQKSSFVQGYFLGNRGLGAWALALTATVQSGGTFMGFPSLVYTYGWIMALWIASYMVVPLTNLGVLGKRIAFISRKSGAVTMPDLYRARFASPTAGLVASLLIMLFMSFMMIAQFKAGALVMKVAWPGTGVLAFDEVEGKIDKAYYVGLAIFSLTVVGYTLIGGFLAAVWTDLFQSVMMFIGVMFLLIIVLPMAGGLERATQVAAENTSPSYALGPGYSPDGRAFLPLTLAFSYFCFWPFVGMASPATVVRVMAVKDTRTLRRSIFLLCTYNLGIYVPLIIICICARAIMPDLTKSDEVIPRITLLATKDLPGGSFIAGMILAAPFGAVMATVSSYLVVIASGLVRDIYQRFIDPDANERTIRRISYLVMIVVGAGAVAANIYPPAFLQTFVVFSSGSAACAFLPTMFMLCYWRRATAPGVVSAMLMGGATSIALYVLGQRLPDPIIGPGAGLRPYYLFGFEPIIWGLVISTITGIVVSLLTQPPPAEVVSKYFDEEATA